MQNYMPSFAGSYSDQERWDVLAYVYSLAFSPELLEQGQEVYGRICANCHAPDGSGGEQAYDFTDQQGMAGLSGADILQVLSTATAPHDFELSAEEAWAAAAYVRTFTFPAAGGESSAIVPLEEALATMEAGDAGSAAEATRLAGEELTPTAGAEMAEASGLTISGKLTNGSGVDVPGEAALTLYGYDQYDMALELTGNTAVDGSFEFSGLDPQVGRLFFITTEYQGTVFASEFVTLQDGQTDIDLPVVIYEVTHDTSVLKAQQLNVFFEFNNPELVQVVQLWVISNPGEQAVAPVSFTEPVLLFPLPEGYSNLMFESGQLGQQFLETADGFGDLITVLPGEEVYQLLYAFQLPYQRALDYAQSISLETDLVQVYIPEDIKVEAADLEFTGLQDLEGTSFNAYEGSQFPAGSELRLRLKGRNPSAGSIFSSLGGRTDLLIGAGGLLLVVVGVALWLRRPHIAGERLEFASAEELVDAIIDLDAAYEAGEINESRYLERRAALKLILAERVERGDGSN